MTGFEPATSASRTQEAVVPNENLSEVTATALEVSASASSTDSKTGPARDPVLCVETDFLTVLTMLERLPLSDHEKAKAVRQLTGSR